MKSRFVLSVVAAVVLASSFSYFAWRSVRDRGQETCIACRRPVHANTRTLAVVDGAPQAYCCPACVLSEHGQTRRSVEVTSLTDYLTGAPISPERAFLVRGSDIQSCGHATAPVGLDKQPVERHFDRCSPSLIAFARRADADTFERHHGGQVLAFSTVAGDYR